MGALHKLDPLDRYTAASERAASQIIGAYSTSFAAATKLFGPRNRRHIRNIYALVRVADELVDGATAQAHLPPEQQHRALDALEAETERALLSGYSSNPIVHAFAHTARSAHIGTHHTRPFFASMRTDLTSNAGPHGDPTAHTSAHAQGIRLSFGKQEHAQYVYGSAEVVGLMCLGVFVRDCYYSGVESRQLEHGAKRLGAAFQNINFLRDLGDDTQRLGRSYLGPGVEMAPELHTQWVTEVRQQLADAAHTLPLLPRDARIAVGCALRLFAKLTDQIAAIPTDQLSEQRIRVSGPRKVCLVLQSLLEFPKIRIK